MFSQVTADIYTMELHNIMYNMQDSNTIQTVYACSNYSNAICLYSYFSKIATYTIAILLRFALAGPFEICVAYMYMFVCACTCLLATS